MNSIKCSQCGLVNWSSAEACKRCQTPIGTTLPPTHQSMDDMSYPSYSSYVLPPQDIVMTPELIEANKHIKEACHAGIFIGAITLLVVLIAIGIGRPIVGVDGWGLVDVVLIFGLTFGIYRKSRTCAVLMLLYYSACKIIGLIEYGSSSGLGLFVSLLFIYSFIKGVKGTFAYHNLTANRSKQSTNELYLTANPIEVNVNSARTHREPHTV
jgi:hypothetical protein